MASGVDGLYGRLRHYESATFRQNHPSFYYRVRDSPGTMSVYCTFASYPASRSRGFLLLAEGHQIAIFALFEHPRFLRVVSSLGMPAVTQSPHQPIIGLNGDAGLQFQGWDNDSAEKARDAKDHQKALEFVTTGFPVSIKQKPLSGRQTIGQIQFMLFHNQAVNSSADLQRCHPQLASLLYTSTSRLRSHTMLRGTIAIQRTECCSALSCGYNSRAALEILIALYSAKARSRNIMQDSWGGFWVWPM